METAIESRNTCPACGSHEIVAGEVRNDQGLNGSGFPAFFLSATRGRFYLLSEPCLYFETEATVCLGCGLVWSRAKVEEARRLQQRHGS